VQEMGELHAKEEWAARPGARRWWRWVTPKYRVGRTRTGTTGSREASSMPAATVGAQERYPTDSVAPLTPHEVGAVTTAAPKKKSSPPMPVAPRSVPAKSKTGNPAGRQNALRQKRKKTGAANTHPPRGCP